MSSINLEYFERLAFDLNESDYIETAKDMFTLVAEVKELQATVASVISEKSIAEMSAYDAGVLDGVLDENERHAIDAAVDFETRDDAYNNGHQYGYSQGHAAGLNEATNDNESARVVAIALEPARDRLGFHIREHQRTLESLGIDQRDDGLLRGLNYVMQKIGGTVE